MKNKKTLTKSDIALAVYNKIGYSKKYCEDLVDDFFETIKKHLKKGQGIQIHGLGKFILKDKKNRRGRNPQTGEELIIKSRRVLLFHASESFKKQF
ncbi:MAG: integration host factor subunit alpha [Bdellovibrionaceae bacterium]|nr:integration host factor subunit alpha [Pseudobdellovibrionaceae bacterium]